MQINTPPLTRYKYAIRRDLFLQKYGAEIRKNALFPVRTGLLD
ncbi:MAG: hypothetical protein ACUBOA_14560 [Candidatus Loosdrechtia sp.]|nr:MAG: hypothetical protein QY305_04355 [Candidatus Jettenia sp. AMX2]